MLIQNFIIGTVCILLMVGVFSRVVIGTEEGEPSPVINDGAEQPIVLVEEHKAYMATPKNTFQYFCAPCHGEFANGKGIYFTIDLKPTPRNLTDVEYMSKLTDDYLLNFISKGSAVMEKSDLCPPWGGTLDEDSIKGVIAYLRGLTIEKSKAEGTPAEKEAEGKEVKVSTVGQKGTPKVVIWSVLIILCVVFVFAARKEWKKLGEEQPIV
jgi:mono/diheme cytochrome c family protein